MPIPEHGVLHSQDLNASSSLFVRLSSSSLNLSSFSRPTLDEIQFNQISSDNARWLEREFTSAEIKEALDSMAGDKAPGPDGFNFSFMKVCWEIVSSDFIRFFKEFFQNGVINKNLKNSFITLIPKRESPVNLSHYRPISLLGSVYKLLAKVLAERLKKSCQK